MQSTRRRMLMTITGAVAAMLADRTVAGQARGGMEQPLPSPNAPVNQNAPVGLDGSEIPVGNGDRPLTPVTWLEIKSDAQKLLQLATDFKSQVDRTNLAATLPLPLIKEAHRIEKLAKQIQQRMKR